MKVIIPPEITNCNRNYVIKRISASSLRQIKKCKQNYLGRILLSIEFALNHCNQEQKVVHKDRR